MLDRIKNLADKMLKLNSNKILKTVLDNKAVQKKIVGFNQYQLYEKGVNSFGKLLGHYAQRTIFYKRNIAASLGNDTRTDHITLKDHGNFYESQKVNNEKDGFIISGDTVKEDGNDLNARFPDILGLDTKSKGDLSQEIKPLVISEVRKKLSGK